jgi:hypothetical protein
VIGFDLSGTQERPKIRYDAERRNESSGNCGVPAMFKTGDLIQLKGENEPWVILGIRDGQAICRRFRDNRFPVAALEGGIHRQEFPLETIEAYVRPTPPQYVPLPVTMSTGWWWV